MRFHLHVGFLLAALLATSVAAAVDPSSTFLSQLVRQNDEQVAGWLVALPPRAAIPREAARVAKMCAAAYAQRESRFHRQPTLLVLLEQMLQTLVSRQNADGSFDAEFAGGNSQSPPDSGFAVRHLAQAAALLRVEASDETRAARETLDRLLMRSAGILRTGGVHTPNHRWVICGALSHLHAIHPAPENVARIDQWLGEGIDQDMDGQYSERSTIYSAVTDEALLDLAVNLSRPELLRPIQRNLELELACADPDGELDTLASRRQDQQGREPRRLAAYYVPLRYLAIERQRGDFAAAVRAIERDDRTRITDSLAEWMLWPTLGQPLPPSSPLPDNMVRHLPNSGLVRIRRGAVTASIFGGGDWAKMHDLSSGLSTNPTFFRFRKGGAVLESIRLTPAFFNLGFFRSEGLEVAAKGNAYRLWQAQRAAYYQPLPAEFRRPDGNYPLTSDGRFYSKMDFPHRPRDEKQLTTRINIRERDDAPGAFELEFEIDGTDGIGVAVELCFRAGGVLTGVVPRETEPDTFFLKTGSARYAVGTDAIEFGPGAFGPSRINMAGEDYSWRNGQLRAEGLRVYVTGVTPFKYTLLIR